MFLLGLLAVAVMPLLVQGLTLSTTNATVAAATQLANQQIEQVRTQQSCALVAPATVSTTANGHTLTATRTVGTCPPASGYPVTVPVSVSVTRADSGAVLAKASTLVFVTAP
jgi:type II secretory pathway pseudopilin PulG